MLRIATCIVAYNRDELLVRALSAVVKQSLAPSMIIVVDNACLQSTEAICNDFGTLYIPGSKFDGSAGGFARAIKASLDANSELMWLLDDDGIPDHDCLEKLVKSLNSLDADAVSPLSTSLDNPNVTSNSFWIGFRKTDETSILKRKTYRKNKIQFYNGVLIKRVLVEKIGLPNSSLFMRGDELDYFYRSRKAKAKLFLCTMVGFRHPSSESEYRTSRSFLFSANIPMDEKKRYYQFRNRGYLVRQNFLLHYLVYDLIRYPVTFLILGNFDFHGFRSWASLYKKGLLGELELFPETK